VTRTELKRAIIVVAVVLAIAGALLAIWLLDWLTTD
jgi:preprotein translocase subunit SecE